MSRRRRAVDKAPPRCLVRDAGLYYGRCLISWSKHVAASVCSRRMHWPGPPWSVAQSEVGEVFWMQSGSVTQKKKKKNSQTLWLTSNMLTLFFLYRFYVRLHRVVF